MRQLNGTYLINQPFPNQPVITSTMLLRLLPYFILIAALVKIVLRLRSPVAKLPGPKYTAWTSLVLKYREFTQGRKVWTGRPAEPRRGVVRDRGRGDS